ncbi:MAG: 50S ribosome-binding GTPase [Nitrospiraceae bacterium]|nr:MAG: 50S ribosome-binding GTPase [Nitrospiraceae bacterium]
MPANLPPEYYQAEISLKQASTPQEKVVALEDLISTIPKHKGTDKIRADLRRRLSRLREEATRKKKAGKGDLYSVEKQGASQVALVGFPNSGKSSLLGAVTNARPVIADYPMSTVMPLSAMMPFEDIQFQLVDLPPIGNESTDGWISAILRSANILMFVVDLSEEPEIQTELLLDQLADWKIPVINPGDREGGKTSPSEKPLIIAANKSDLPGTEGRLMALKQRYGTLYPSIGCSAHSKGGIEELRNSVFEQSRIIRVYAKQPGKKPDMATPFTLPVGSHVLVLAEIIHKDFVKNFKYACIWGSARFDGQRVQKDYILHDRDIVEYHAR